MPEDSEVFVGETRLQIQSQATIGNLVLLGGEQFYKISNYDQMRPFFMSLPSDSDIWMFVSSRGGLTTGRKNADQAIFPYYTEDQITQLSETTGSKTVFQVQRGTKWQLWLPFSDQFAQVYKITRNLYKNALGNKLIFEEINHSLGLGFQYSWLNSRKFGIIKKSEITHLSDDLKDIRLLDGLQNLMPPGILQHVQQTKSNLANAYKRNELRIHSGIGIYSLSSNIIDRPTPSEALKATTVWAYGLGLGTHLLSDRQLNHFIRGAHIREETEVRGEPGAYFIAAEIALDQNATQSWYFVADTLKNATAIVALEQMLKSQHDIPALIEAEIRNSTENLLKIISLTDGIQLSADAPGNVRHLTNTLFNVMRGGFFANGYTIDKKQFLDFVQGVNRNAAVEMRAIVSDLPEKLHINVLKQQIASGHHSQLTRYAYEYLPVSFSRRHGDPSRPWNKFNIDVLSEDGAYKQCFEGNWRDIFQNWEALCWSFPEFTENVITLFLNASTIDGYNPYRITNKGVEWEITDPDDPWSFIGYWGDHQIIYLLKLLEISKKFHPGWLVKNLAHSLYTFANVPYRIRDYEKILQNPYNTIDFDEEEEKRIEARVQQYGSDGKLLWVDGKIANAALIEKLLIPLLTKLSNFVPEGGIWMNTQRPEWNDANNALVGHGLSMVTVYYISRYLDFLNDLIGGVDTEFFETGMETKIFFKDILNIFSAQANLLSGRISDTDRKRLTDSLGIAGEKYRRSVYHDFSGGKTKLARKDILTFLSVSKSFIAHSIKHNKRTDLMYHAYNLLEFNTSGYGVRHLYPMLEGQVAVLSSGFIQAAEALEILNSLKRSDLYRADQQSYILYPDRQLRNFVDKARIDSEMVRNSALLNQLLEQRDNSIILKDEEGNFHFNEDLCNAHDLELALDRLKDVADAEKEKVLKIYESVFNHHEFTGRSGTFFGYEGLGSVYWHMNSKLLLAVQEIWQKAEQQNGQQEIISALRHHYSELKAGLGTNKSPEIYGAFPIDPYSHTPANKGAQQPGMTGQVKEDLLSRLGELGVSVENGVIGFSKSFLPEDEFLRSDDDYKYFDGNGNKRSIPVSHGSLAFSFCGIPVIYVQSNEDRVEISYNDGETQHIAGLTLETETSRNIFARQGDIGHIRVYFDWR